jgi:hypothetical protein
MPLIKWKTCFIIKTNAFLATYLLAYMSNWISSGMGMNIGGIPTTEKHGCPADNKHDNRFFNHLK